MKKLFALTLALLLATSCALRHENSYSSKTMTNKVGTQDQLDQGNQRINAFREELLRQGFREVSASFSDSKEVFVLAGQYGRLKDLRVTLQTDNRLEEDKPELAGGIAATITGEQANHEFEELYKKVVFVVTGRAY